MSSTDCWKYFNKSVLKDKAICKTCNKELSIRGSSTTGLIRHLEGVHNILPKRRSDLNENTIGESSAEPTPKKLNNSILNFVKRESLEELVARMAAHDGISINAINKSSFIRQSLRQRGFNVPDSPTTTMKLVHKFFATVNQGILDKIKKLKKQEEKFSISVDEGSSFINRKYLNIIIYYQDGTYDNLGLVRMRGSHPAEKLLEVLINKLSEYELSLSSDIIKIICDAASVMVKMGYLSETTLQLCYNHALQIAVLNVLYKKTQSQVLNISHSEGDSSSDNDDGLDSEGFNIDFVNDNVENNFTINDNFKILIEKVRAIVKLFKRSGIKNEILQKYVIEQEQKELKLLLDCPTRWGSLANMLERFCQISHCIVRAINDLNCSHLWDEKDTSKLIDLVNVLNPIKIAVEALSRRDCNLLKAEGVLEVLFKTLKRESSQLSAILIEELKVQLVKRRDKPLITLLKFFHNPQKWKVYEDNFFAPSSKAEIIRLAQKCLEQYFPSEVDNANTSEEEVMETNVVNEARAHDIQNLKTTMTREMESAIEQYSTSFTPAVDTSEIRNVGKDMMFFEARGQMSAKFAKLFKALKTIRPTSTENERSFSTCENFVSKKRNRLSDDSVNALCTLKNFFLKLDSVKN